MKFRGNPHWIQQCDRQTDIYVHTEHPGARQNPILESGSSIPPSGLMAIERYKTHFTI